MDSTRLKGLLCSGLALAPLGLALSVAACAGNPDSLVLGATTSVYDSGLIEHLVSRFGEEHPQIRVRIVIAGSGEVLELGRRGDVDLLLVHAPEAEQRFIEAGHAPRRRPVMYNSFVIAGPAEDVAGVSRAASPAAAFASIARAGAAFVSRGDSSGTHYREVALWREAGVKPEGRAYIESGEGQATTLQVASERSAYVLSDGATLTVLSGVLDLERLFEDHPDLRNVYSVLQPAAAYRPVEAGVLADWLLSSRARAAIAGFHARGDTVPLFKPWLSENPADGRGTPEVEGDSLATPDSVRGSAARGSPAHHVG